MFPKYLSGGLLIGIPLVVYGCTHPADRFVTRPTHVHAVRLDFSQVWLDITPDQYAHAAWGVLRIVERNHGIKLDRILLTTDETDEDWL